MKAGVDNGSVQALLRNFDKKSQSLSKAVRRAWFDQSLATLDNAVKRAPLEDGELRESGWMTAGGRLVARGEIDGAKAFTRGPAEHVEIGFTAGHATAQHEDTSLQHPEGEAKFLEKAVLDLEAQALTTLDQAARRGLRE